ncbi:MAG: hypothetical protein EOP34_06530 [Rickettsiales bacterium]|nr:MAG: hypothetical protein EOP34_06530 [Rickettsiales bacterium]
MNNIKNIYNFYKNIKLPITSQNIYEALEKNKETDEFSIFVAISRTLEEYKENTSEEIRIEDLFYHSVEKYNIISEEKKTKQSQIELLDECLNIKTCALIGLGIAAGAALPMLLATTAITFATDLFFHENIYNASQKAAKTFVTGLIGIAAAMGVAAMTGGVIIPAIVGAGVMYAAPKAYSFVNDYVINRESKLPNIVRA